MSAFANNIKASTENECAEPLFHAARWMMRVLAVAGFVAALVYAYYFIFSRSMSLDEGYLMITVQGFNSGNALYDTVFTQYGPFYYFYEWIVRAVMCVPLTHDATRFLCIAHWLVASVVLGAAAWRMTRSSLAGVFVAAQAMMHLSAIANEPGHPQEIVVVLLALGIFVCARTSPKRWTVEALAIIAALLVFTKINVGLFFGVALFLTMRCHSSDRFARGAWNWLLLTLCSVLPFVLMRHHLDAEWCRNFAIVATSAVVATLLVAQRVSRQDVLEAKNYLSAAGAFGVAAALLLGITFLTGTTWRGLLDGMLFTPLKMTRVALLFIAFPNATVINAVLSLVMAALVVFRRSDARFVSLLTILKVGYALVGALWLVGDVKQELVYLVPWVWIVAVPSEGRAWSTHESFARTFLCLAAAWQSLQAYPIAGTQVTLATFLLVLTYGVCLNDALGTLARALRVQKGIAALTPQTFLLTRALAALALLFLFVNIWCKLPQVRREYAQLRPLDLPGSRHVRMNDEAVGMYSALAKYLSTESDTFVCYPGVNSLYLWTGQRPPTQLNSTGWGQLSHVQQEKILGALRDAKRPRLVVVEALMHGWDSPDYDAIRPLARFITQECHLVGRLGRFVIFEPRTNAVTANR